MGQDHVQIRQMQMLLFFVLHQRLRHAKRFFPGPLPPHDGFIGKHGMEDAGEFGDRVRGKNGGKAPRSFCLGIVGVRCERESDGRVTGKKGVFLTVDLHGAFAVEHDDQFHRFMHMQRERIFRHGADKEIVFPKLVKGFQRNLPPFAKAVYVPLRGKRSMEKLRETCHNPSSFS